MHLGNLIPISEHDHGKSNFCILRALHNHVTDAFRPDPQPRILIPHQLSNNLELISKSFQLGRQQDAHEYLVLLFGKLDACDPNLVKQIFGGYLLIRYIFL
ncbi:hypothetical protein RYX36_017207 [Vicia faba]